GAAGDVDEDVFGGEAEFGAFLEDGDDHGDAVGRDAGDLALGGTDDGGGGEGLDLDEEDAGALHGGGDDRARGLAALFVLLREEASGIGDFFQTPAGHLEEADLVGAAETVLDAAYDAMGVEAITLEVDDG